MTRSHETETKTVASRVTETETKRKTKIETKRKMATK